MTEIPTELHGETPTVEVRVYRDGALWRTELCESEEEAADAVRRWSELEGTTYEVDDLTNRHRSGEVFEPDPADLVDEGDYPEQAEEDLDLE